MSDDNKTYKVGYKKPPKHTQFKKGEASRNPKGRPKQSKNMNYLVWEAMNKKITITCDGVKKKVTVREAMAQRLIADALKGNHKAIERVLKIVGEVTLKEREYSTQADLDKLLDRLSLEELQDTIDGLMELGRQQREGVHSGDLNKLLKNL